MTRSILVVVAEATVLVFSRPSLADDDMLLKTYERVGEKETIQSAFIDGPAQFLTWTMESLTSNQKLAGQTNAIYMATNVISALVVIPVDASTREGTTREGYRAEIVRNCCLAIRNTNPHNSRVFMSVLPLLSQYCSELKRCERSLSGGMLAISGPKTPKEQARIESSLDEWNRKHELNMAAQVVMAAMRVSLDDVIDGKRLAETEAVRLVARILRQADVDPREIKAAVNETRQKFRPQPGPSKEMLQQIKNSIKKDNYENN